MLLFCSMHGCQRSYPKPCLVVQAGGRVCGFRDLFLVFCLIFDLAVVDWWEAAKSKIKGLPVTTCKNCVACLRSQRDLPLSQVDNGSVSFVGPNLSAHVELRKLDLEKL